MNENAQIPDKEPEDIWLNVANKAWDAVAEGVKKLRKEKRMSLKEISDMLGLKSPAHIAEWTRDENPRRAPNSPFPNMLRYLDILGYKPYISFSNFKSKTTENNVEENNICDIHKKTSIYNKELLQKISTLSRTLYLKEADIQFLSHKSGVLEKEVERLNSVVSRYNREEMSPMEFYDALFCDPYSSMGDICVTDNDLEESAKIAEKFANYKFKS